MAATPTAVADSVPGESTKMLHPMWLGDAGADRRCEPDQECRTRIVLIQFLVEGTYFRYLGIIVFIYGIVAVGLNILAGYAGQFSLGHAALMAMGAYTTALLSKALAPIPFFAATGIHIWISIVLGTCVAAGLGTLLAFPALRVRGPYLAMVTIAFGWVIFKILQEWVSVTGGDLGISSIPKPQVGPWRLETAPLYYVVLALFV